MFILFKYYSCEDLQSEGALGSLFLKHTQTFIYYINFLKQHFFFLKYEHFNVLHKYFIYNMEMFRIIWESI